MSGWCFLFGLGQVWEMGLVGFAGFSGWAWLGLVVASCVFAEACEIHHDDDGSWETGWCGVECVCSSIFGMTHRVKDRHD